MPYAIFIDMSRHAFAVACRRFLLIDAFIFDATFRREIPDNSRTAIIRFAAAFSLRHTP